MTYNQVTLASLRSALQERVASAPFWTNADALQAINEAIRVWNALTGEWKTRTTISTEIGRVFYFLPASILAPYRITIGNAPLAQTTISDLDSMKPGWQSQTTATGGDVPTSVKVWAPVGLDAFCIWPAKATSVVNMEVDSIQDAPVLVNDTDFIDIGTEEQYAIISYALHTILYKEGGARWSNSVKLYTEFMLAAANKNERLRASTFYREFMGLDTDRNAVPPRFPIVPKSPQQGEVR